MMRSLPFSVAVCWGNANAPVPRSSILYLRDPHFADFLGAFDVSAA